MANVLVTGGSGFLGGHLVERLEADAHNVTILDVTPPAGFTFNGSFLNGDTRDAALIEQACSSAEVVFHLAGVLGTGETFKDAVRTTEINIIGMLHLLQAAQRTQCAVVQVGLKNDWLNPYMISKQAASRYCQMYHAHYGVKVVMLHITNAYGSRQSLAPVRKLVPTFIARALENAPLETYGDGEQEVDLIHIDDVVDAMVQTMQVDACWGETIEIGTGSPTTVNAFANVLLQLTNSRSEIVYMPMRPGEPMRSSTVAHTEKARALLGFHTKVTLDDGLRATIPYYQRLVRTS